MANPYTLVETQEIGVNKEAEEAVEVANLGNEELVEGVVEAVEIDEIRWQ